MRLAALIISVLAATQNVNAFLFFAGGGSSADSDHAKNVDNGNGTNVFLNGTFSGEVFLKTENAVDLNDFGVITTFYLGPDYTNAFWGGGESYYLNGTTNGPVIFTNKYPDSAIFPASVRWVYFFGGAIFDSPTTTNRLLQTAWGWGNEDRIKVSTHHASPIAESPALLKLLALDGSGLTNSAGSPVIYADNFILNNSLVYQGGFVPVNGNLDLNANSRVIFDSDGDQFASIFWDINNASNLGLGNGTYISAPGGANIAFIDGEQSLWLAGWDASLAVFRASAFLGDGHLLTSLNSTNLIGTIPGARLSGLTTNIPVIVTLAGLTKTLCFTNGLLKGVQ